VQLLYFRCQPRLAHRSPPRSFFYNCILQGAVDLRSCGADGGAKCRMFFGVAGFAPT